MEDPSIFSISTRDNPRGQGRWGERVEKTPTRSPPKRGGATLALGCELLRWKWYMSHICEKSARPSSECSGFVKMPSFNSTILRRRLPTLDCRGTARFSGKAVRMIPIGLNWATSSSQLAELCNSNYINIEFGRSTYLKRTCSKRTDSNLSLSLSLLLVFLLLAQPSQRKSCSSRLIVSMSLRCTCCKLRTCCLMLHM